MLLSPGSVADKYWFCGEARVIAEELKLPIFATEGTAEVLAGEDISCTRVGKRSGEDQSAMDLISEGKVDLVINIPREYDQYGRPDGYLIRRRAVDQVVSWNDYLDQAIDLV